MARTERPAPKRDREEIVVFWTRREATCHECGQDLGRGSFIRLRDGQALCLDCADLDHLVFLPRGDATLTRRAGKHSRLRAVVVRWSATRRRYERQGILVEEEALRRAEEECEQDAGQRVAQRARAAVHREERDRRYVEEFARAIRKRYPGRPEDVELEIATYACQKYSGRVGRSAAAKRLDLEAIELAVRAHVRHRHTRYDDYLMAGWERDEARAAVGEEVEEILAGWERGPAPVGKTGARAGR